MEEKRKGVWRQNQVLHRDRGLERGKEVIQVDHLIFGESDGVTYIWGKVGHSYSVSGTLLGYVRDGVAYWYN